jgi:hypothetical protein
VPQQPARQQVAAHDYHQRRHDWQAENSQHQPDGGISQKIDPYAIGVRDTVSRGKDQGSTERR